jgi:hypothetical protein
MVLMMISMMVIVCIDRAYRHLWHKEKAKGLLGDFRNQSGRNAMRSRAVRRH